MKFLIVLLQIIFFSVVFGEGCNPVYEEVVYDMKQNKIIHSFNIDQQTQPASLTKMMTLYITFLKIKSGDLKLSDRIYFSKAAVNQSPSILGVKIRESITVREAILALVTKSANDVAVALAEKISGTEGKFVVLMNSYAKSLKMNSTVFRNASGWKDKQQLTTARDMVKLSLALIRRFPSFYSYFGIKSFSFGGKKWCNHNNLLCKSHSKFKKSNIIVDGIKTGYVAASGFNLSASATNGKGRRLIAVILGGPTAKWRDERMAEVLYSCFENRDLKSSNIGSYYCKKRDNCLGKGKLVSKVKSKVSKFVICKETKNKIIKRKGVIYGKGKNV